MAAPHSTSISYDPEADVCYRTLDFMEFPGYRVGDDGSVWTAYQRGRGRRFFVGQTWYRLSPKRQKTGHLLVGLYRGGRRVFECAHRLILTAFAGAPDPGQVTRHFPDREPSNNRLANLRWGTAAENSADKWVHGTAAFGERSPLAKLTPEVVREIRRLRESGLSQQAIGRRVGASQTHIGRILRGKYWSHV